MKTGTCSLAIALEVLGSNVYYHSSEHFNLQERLTVSKLITFLTFSKIFIGADAVTDQLPAFWFEEILNDYLEAKVIQTRRETPRKLGLKVSKNILESKANCCRSTLKLYSRSRLPGEKRVVTLTSCTARFVEVTTPKLQLSTKRTTANQTPEFRQSFLQKSFSYKTSNKDRNHCVNFLGCVPSPFFLT